MFRIRHLTLAGFAALTSISTAAPPAPASALEQLAGSSVSRLEWGIDKLRRALVETFAIDPLSLEPSSPPFFVNVGYDKSAAKIRIEIGQTYPSLDDSRARTECETYIERVRGFLSVDKVGRPAIGNSSALAAEYFHPLGAAEPPAEAFARDLDHAVTLRGLVASPLNGVYAICTAGLVDTPIRHLE